MQPGRHRSGFPCIRGSVRPHMSRPGPTLPVSVLKKILRRHEKQLALQEFLC